MIKSQACAYSLSFILIDNMTVTSNEVSNCLNNLEDRIYTELRAWEHYHVNDFPAIKSNIQWVITALEVAKTQHPMSSDILQEDINNWKAFLNGNSSFEIIRIFVDRSTVGRRIVEWKAVTIKLNETEFQIPEGWLKK